MKANIYSWGIVHILYGIAVHTHNCAVHYQLSYIYCTGSLYTCKIVQYITNYMYTNSDSTGWHTCTKDISRATEPYSQFGLHQLMVHAVSRGRSYVPWRSYPTQSSWTFFFEASLPPWPTCTASSLLLSDESTVTENSNCYENKKQRN